MRFLTTCGDPDCPELIPSGARYCSKHTREVDAAIKARTAEWRWVYDDPRWAALRRTVRREFPFCQWPDGCRELGTDVDHVVALQDGGEPFDRANVQHLCKRHHGQKTADEVRSRR